MGYRHFEELPVWNAAIDLAIQVYDLTASGQFRSYSGLKDQLERAVLSISNNIAEGFERGTTAELISFLYIARGSAGEVRSMIALLQRLEVSDDRALIDLKTRVTDVSRQLGAWISSLQSAKIQGPRTLTEQQKADQSATRRRDEFMTQLRRVQNPTEGDQRFDPPS